MCVSGENQGDCEIFLDGSAGFLNLALKESVVNLVDHGCRKY